MAQKANPLAFRSLNNFENSFCHQQVYKKNLSPYVLKEHKKIKSFVESFFKSTNLVLHSFKFVKTYQGIAYLYIKYVHVSDRDVRESSKSIYCSNIERAFLCGFSKLCYNVPISVSFFNLEKGAKQKIPATNIKGTFFNVTELATYLHVLTSVKGSAFFLANILSSKLHNMRSRSDRKSQVRFLSFVSNLLSFIIEHNTVGIEGVKVGIKGRINGVPRSKTWSSCEGKMTLQRIDSKVDYYYLPSETVYGTFGIKVWINYG